MDIDFAMYVSYNFNIQLLDIQENQIYNCSVVGSTYFSNISFPIYYSIRNSLGAAYDVLNPPRSWRVKLTGPDITSQEIIGVTVKFRRYLNWFAQEDSYQEEVTTSKGALNVGEAIRSSGVNSNGYYLPATLSIIYRRS